MPGRAPDSRLALLALLLAALLVLAGCGRGDDAAEDAAERPDATATDAAAAEVEAETNEVTQAAAATLAAGSARVAYDAMFEGSEGSYSFAAEGDVDYAAQRSRLSYDMSNLPGTGAADVDVRHDGGTVYVHFPDGPPDMELPEGREWIRLPPPQAPEGEEAPAPALDLGGVQQDPTQFLRFLVTGATEVQQEDWEEEVRGEETTIYTALLDMERVLAGGGEGFGDDEAARAAGLRSAEALRAQLGEVEIPVTVNVDSEGRIVRVLLSFDLQTGALGGAVSALTTTEYHDFGADVEVAPPPEEQVVDAADVQ